MSHVSNARIVPVEDHPSDEGRADRSSLYTKAVEFISRNELKIMHHLFLLYDSSVSGDALPSVHCKRYMKFMHDISMIGDTFTDERAKETFASAALSRLRTYLDQDEIPALPFRLFCVGLFLAAMAKYPNMSLSMAMIQVVEKKIIPFYHRISTSEGLTGPMKVKLNAIKSKTPLKVSQWSSQYWELDDALTVNRDLVEPCVNDVHAIEHCTVLASANDTSKDDVTDSTLAMIPTGLLSHFRMDVSDKILPQFAIFDVHGHGRLEQAEIFAYLSSLSSSLSPRAIHELMTKIRPEDIISEHIWTLRDILELALECPLVMADLGHELSKKDHVHPEARSTNNDNDKRRPCSTSTTSDPHTTTAGTRNRVGPPGRRRKDVRTKKRSSSIIVRQKSMKPQPPPSVIDHVKVAAAATANLHVCSQDASKEIHDADHHHSHHAGSDNVNVHLDMHEHLEDLEDLRYPDQKPLVKKSKKSQRSVRKKTGPRPPLKLRPMRLTRENMLKYGSPASASPFAPLSQLVPRSTLYQKTRRSGFSVSTAQYHEIVEALHLQEHHQRMNVKARLLYYTSNYYDHIAHDEIYVFAIESMPTRNKNRFRIYTRGARIILGTSPE